MAFDPTFLIAACDGHRTRLEAVVFGEGQEFGIEANRIAHAFEHDALEIVIEDRSDGPAKRIKCLDVATQEAVHLGIEAEAQEDAPRVAQHHHEAHERAPRTADLQVIEVGPVTLHLFTRQRAQAQVGLGRRPWPHRAHQVSEVAGLPRIAALAHHVMQPAGRQRRVLLQRLADEGPVRIDKARAQRHAWRRHVVFTQHTAHRVAVHVQLARDGPHAPALDREQTLDACGQIKRDGHDRRAVERCACASNPGAHGPATGDRNAGIQVQRMGPRRCSPARRRGPIAIR